MLNEVHVGPFTFRVASGGEVVDFFRGADNDAGDCDSDRLLIRVNTLDLADGTQRDTLLHELVHAVLFERGVNLTEKQEEDVARNLGTGLLALMRDNPELIEYLCRTDLAD